MPTTAQTAVAINRNFGIANAEHWASKLRGAGFIQSSQGAALDLPEKDVVKILLGVMIGFAATKNPDLINEYYGLASPEGDIFGEAVERFLAAPHDLYEMAISNAIPAAAISYRAADRSTQTAIYTGA